MSRCSGITHHTDQAIGQCRTRLCGMGHYPMQTCLLCRPSCYSLWTIPALMSPSYACSVALRVPKTSMSRSTALRQLTGFAVHAQRVCIATATMRCRGKTAHSMEPSTLHLLVVPRETWNVVHAQPCTSVTVGFN